MDPRDRFTATIEEYKRHRPDYPDELFDWLLPHAGLGAGSVVVDVGCGTGIFTRQLASRGLRVIGVDPNETMLSVARESRGDGIQYILGDAETLPIGEALAAMNASAPDAIVGAQAFHWIDLDRALPRFASALAPNARVLAVWNLRETSEGLMGEYEALLLRHCEEYPLVGAEPRATRLAEHPGVTDLEEKVMASEQVLDRDGFFGRVWSSSYVRHSFPDATKLDATGRFGESLHELFDRYERDGRVRLVYRTLALSFRPRR